MVKRESVGSKAFGQQLSKMRQQAGWSQDRLADEMSQADEDGAVYTRDHFSKVETGERLPTGEVLAALLCVFAGEAFGLPAPQDAQAWVGQIGRSLSRRELERLYPGSRFRLPFMHAFVPAVSATYVRRELEGRLVEMATGLSGCRAIVLHGLSGMGKTTLAAGVAGHPAVAAAFRDGILWVDAAQGDAPRWARSLCLSLGLDRRSRSWLAAWREWSAGEGRRFLLIVDDAGDEASLGALAGQLGPQAVALVTTQRRDVARAALVGGLLPGQIAEVDVWGMRPEEGRRLFELRQERPLQEAECAVVQEIGERVGWHAGVLSLVSAGREVDDWRVAFAGLDGEGEFSFQVALRRQWGRMSPLQRQWMEQLLGAMRRGQMFTPLFAADAWQAEVSEARDRLRHLGQTGMVERLRDAVDPFDRQAELWRAAPLVWQMFGRGGVMSEPLQGRARLHRLSGGALGAEMQRLRVRYQKAGHVLRYADLQMPGWFGVWVSVWMAVGGLPKAVGRGVVAVLDAQDRRGWRKRWDEWTIVLSAERSLLRVWAQRGVPLTEDLVLLYDRFDLAAVKGFWWVCGLAAVSVLASLLMAVWAPDWLESVGYRVWLGAIWAGLLVGYGRTAWPVAWRVWLAHRYGVKRWDIDLPLRVAAWVKELDRRVDKGACAGDG